MRKSFIISAMLFVAAASAFHADAAGRRNMRSERIPDGESDPRCRAEIFAEVSEKKVYAGETFTYTVTLETSNPDIYAISPADRSAVDDRGGLTIAARPQSSRYQIRSLRTRGRYAVDITYETLVARQPGKYTIPASEYIIEFYEGSRSYDPWFGFMNAEVFPVSVKVPDTKVTVRSLPKAPEGFTGAVGDYSIKCNYSQVELDKGGDMLLSYIVEGRGYLGDIDIPDFRSIFGEGVRLRSVLPRDSYYYSDGELCSRVIYEVSISAADYGNFMLPPMKFIYFNPSTGKYETAESEAVNVKVASPKKRYDSPGQYVYLPLDATYFYPLFSSDYQSIRNLIHAQC